MTSSDDRPRLTLFDLDHTLLTGDSDVLWCDFLIRRGLLDGDAFAARNADMEARYRAGSVSVQEFTEFYVGTLAGRSAVDSEPLRQAFLDQEIAPRIPPTARDLVAEHLANSNLVVMTTATNRYLTELTARHLNIEHLIASEPEVVDGRFTGRTTGVLNMREGKVARLHAWLAGRGASLEDFEVSAYSDSMNDLPLLQIADHPTAVDPDPRLLAWAREHGHRVLKLR